MPGWSRCGPCGSARSRASTGVPCTCTTARPGSAVAWSRERAECRGGPVCGPCGSARSRPSTCTCTCTCPAGLRSPGHASGRSAGVVPFADPAVPPARVRARVCRACTCPCPAGLRSPGHASGRNAGVVPLRTLRFRPLACEHECAVHVRMPGRSAVAWSRERAECRGGLVADPALPPAREFGGRPEQPQPPAPPAPPAGRQTISPAPIAWASTRSDSAPSSTRRSTFAVTSVTTNATVTDAPAKTYAAEGE